MKVNVKRMLKVLALFFLGLFLFAACSEFGSNHAGPVMMVPADAAVVVDIDLKSLHSKVSSEQLENSPFYELISKKTDALFVNLFHNDSVKTGIDYDELVMFVLSDESFAVATQLDDASEFESLVKLTAESASLSITITKNGDAKTCALDTNLVLVWNTEKALIMKGADLHSTLGIFNQDVSQSIFSNKDFAQFYAEKEDMAVWMAMQNYMKLVSKVPQFKQAIGFPIMDEYEEMYEGVYSSYNVAFLDGEIVATGMMTPMNKAKELSSIYYKEQQSKKLLTAVPGDSYLLFSAALEFSEFSKIYASLPQFEELLKKPKTKEILESIEGNVVFSISDFATGPLPIPNAVVALTVSDHKLMDSFLDMGGVQKVEKEGYTALLVQMFQVFVSQKEGVLLLTTNEDVIKSFASGEVLVDNLTVSQHKKTVESVAYYYMNLDLESYPMALTGLLGGKMGAEYTALSQAMCFEDITSWYDYEACEIKTVVKMKDKEENSLSALFNLMNVVMTLNK